MGINFGFEGIPMGTNPWVKIPMGTKYHKIRHPTASCNCGTKFEINPSSERVYSSAPQDSVSFGTKDIYKDDDKGSTYTKNEESHNTYSRN